MPTAKPRTKAGQQRKTHKVMEEYKEGKLKSGPGGKGGKVKSRKQAIAIAMSEAGTSRKRKTAKKSTSRKTKARKTTTKRRAA